MTTYERIFQKIVKDEDVGKETAQSGKQTIEQRNDMVNSIEKEFKHVFNQFYQRVATKDKLEGLTD
jgi:oligoendopeptidase F